MYIYIHIYIHGWIYLYVYTRMDISVNIYIYGYLHMKQRLYVEIYLQWTHICGFLWIMMLIQHILKVWKVKAFFFTAFFTAICRTPVVWKTWSFLFSLLLINGCLKADPFVPQHLGSSLRGGVIARWEEHLCREPLNIFLESLQPQCVHCFFSVGVAKTQSKISNWYLLQGFFVSSSQNWVGV